MIITIHYDSWKVKPRSHDQDNMAELKPEMMQYAVQGIVCALSGVVMAQGWLIDI